MRRSANTTISSFLFQSQGAVWAVLFFFAAGLSSGVFLELFLGTEDKLAVEDYLTRNLFLSGGPAASGSPVFSQSAVNNLGLLLLILAAGISVIGFPAVFFAVAYKGMALGFSSALLIDSMSGKGVVVILLSMVPQNLILIPVFLAASVAAVNAAAKVFSGRQRGVRNSLSQNAGPYFSLFAVLASALLLGCLVEAFISPALLRLAG